MCVYIYTHIWYIYFYIYVTGIKPGLLNSSHYSDEDYQSSVQGDTGCGLPGSKFLSTQCLCLCVGHRSCSRRTDSSNHTSSQALHHWVSHIRVSKKPKSRLRFWVRSFKPENSTAVDIKAAKCQVYAADTWFYHSTQGKEIKPWIQG